MILNFQANVQFPTKRSISFNVQQTTGRNKWLAFFDKRKFYAVAATKWFYAVAVTATFSVDGGPNPPRPPAPQWRRGPF